MRKLVVMVVWRVLKSKILARSHQARMCAIEVYSWVDLVVEERGEWAACRVR
jgi:hypothetical protein